MNTHTVTLPQLRFGHDRASGSSVNARSTGRTEGLDDLKKSILAHGLIQPLVVRVADEGFEVIAGNRRLAALQGLAADASIPADELIDVLVVDADDTYALELSLAENVVRLPLHPVDQFEAFAALATGPRAITKKAIAERFNIGKKDVERTLALGGLAPEVRDAWRAGKINADTAQAFTLTRDQARQREVLARLRKDGNLYWQNVRHALAPNSTEASGQLVQFVGLDAYKAAGGAVVSDLFSDRKYVSDPALVERLAAEKLAATIETVKAEGWSWVRTEEEIGVQTYAWERVQRGPLVHTPEEEAELEAVIAARSGENPDHDDLNLRLANVRIAAEARAFTDADKARAGCVVSVGYGGEARIQRGLVDPATSKAEARAANIAEGKPEGLKPIGAPLAQALSEQQSAALAEVLAGDRNLAFALLLATLATEKRSGGSPCCIKASGRGAAPDGTAPGANRAEWLTGKFPAVLDEAQTLGLGEGLDLLAAFVADAIDSSLSARGLTTSFSKGVQPSSIAAVIERADPEAWRAAQAKHFDADAYFASATKAHAITALTEMHGRNTCISPKKGDIAALAAVDAKRLGWLPGELRTVHYDGPGAPKKVAPKKRATKVREAA